MSNNPNYNKNFRNNCFTFQNQHNFTPIHEYVPPLPPPPCFFLPPMSAPPPRMAVPPPRMPTPPSRTVGTVADQDFLKSFEKPPNNKKDSLPTKMSISQVKEKFKNIVLTLNSLKDKERYLHDNLGSLSEENWSSVMQETEQLKYKINKEMSTLNDTYLKILGNLVAKRTAKRLRLKRVRKERQAEQKQRVKEMKERSRKIDENLQKIKDDIDKAKQEEESKIHADIVLKETLRKKNDAKKCVVKLDALMKLRRARQNTAKGRGQNVSDKEAATFNNNIEKLKSMWAQKLSSYKQEEKEMRARLCHDSIQTTSSAIEREIADNISKWRCFLYGDDVTPQFDFRGHVRAFVKVRCQWDQYISTEGSPIPVGWATPHNH